MNDSSGDEAGKPAPKADMNLADLKIAAWLSPTKRTAGVSVECYAPGWAPLVLLSDVLRLIDRPPLSAETCVVSVPPGSFLAKAVGLQTKKAPLQPAEGQRRGEGETGALS